LLRHSYQAIEWLGKEKPELESALFWNKDSVVRELPSLLERTGRSPPGSPQPEVKEKASERKRRSKGRMQKNTAGKPVLKRAWNVVQRRARNGAAEETMESPCNSSSSIESEAERSFSEDEGLGQGQLIDEIDQAMWALEIGGGPGDIEGPAAA
jgi:hypothetical protein